MNGASPYKEQQFKRYHNKLSLKNKVLRFLWTIVWLLFFRSTPRWAFRKWRIAILRIFGAQIGKNSRVVPTCNIWAPWNLVLGEVVCLGDNVDCYNVDKIVIGNNVAVSQRSFLCTASHRIDTLERELIHRPIKIEDHVWIGSEAFIGPGVKIGEGAIVGARAVVTKDVDSWKVVAGNPAKVIKKRELKNG